METAIIYIYIVVLHPLCEAAPWSATMHTKFVALYENGLQDLVFINNHKKVVFPLYLNL